MTGHEANEIRAVLALLSEYGTAGLVWGGPGEPDCPRVLEAISRLSALVVDWPDTVMFDATRGIGPVAVQVECSNMVRVSNPSGSWLARDLDDDGGE